MRQLRLPHLLFSSVFVAKSLVIIAFGSNAQRTWQRTWQRTLTVNLELFARHRVPQTVEVVLRIGQVNR
jgi:hypothetical protein